MPPSLPAYNVTPPAPVGTNSPACWSGCVVVPGIGELASAHCTPATTSAHAFQYRPITFHCVGAITPAGTAFCQISSRPNATRVGAPVTGSVAVGSTEIQLLYQDWSPGPVPRSPNWR